MQSTVSAKARNRDAVIQEKNIWTVLFSEARPTRLLKILYKQKYCWIILKGTELR